MSLSAAYINPTDLFGGLLNPITPSPTAAARQLAGVRQMFSLMTLNTGTKLGSRIYYHNLLTVYEIRMQDCLQQFVQAQSQELSAWQAQHPNATPEEQAAFAQQQAQALEAFAAQVAAWHEEYVTKWAASPLA